MTDTHCHLNYPPLDADIEAVIGRARAASVTRFVIPGTQVESSRSAVDVASRFPGVYAAVGNHPTDRFDGSVLAELRALLAANPAIRAVGEIGLDYFHLEESPDPGAQAEAFRAQIALAKEFGKPLIIHSRDAFDDIYSILSEDAGYPVVIHCFTGTADEARAWLDLGFMLSFTGIITYPKNGALRDVVRDTPLDRMMIETDAPYLAPQKYRGTPCEPAYVADVCAMVAEVKGISAGEVEAATDANATKFFSLD